MTRRPADCSRRDFVRLVGGGTALLLGCAPGESGSSGGGVSRLTARPGTPTQSVSPGEFALGLDNVSHDAYLRVPAGYLPGQPTPLLVAFHGAGGRASGPLGTFGPYAESNGFLLLAVDSYFGTWDALSDSYGKRYGPDVQFLDRALGWVFDHCRIDPNRLVIEGFSDGASYALGLGLTNGDLFPRIVAFSAGYIPRSDSARAAKPELFVSHGRQDPVLNIDRASRIFVPELRGAGYTVTYVEFEGGHGIPAAIADQAVQWLLR